MVILDFYAHFYFLSRRSIYHLTMLATPYLIQSKGSIVNVSSVNGLRSFPGLLAYNISKSAVDQLTRCVAIGMYYITSCRSMFVGHCLWVTVCRSLYVGQCM